MKGYLTEPAEIMKQSMRAITKILGDVAYSAAETQVIKRVINTTADFHYAKILEFNHDPLGKMMSAIRRGRNLVTDTPMTAVGIDRRVLSKYEVEVKCYSQGEDVNKTAQLRGVTNFMAGMEKASQDKQNGIFVIGHDATALFRLLELSAEGLVKPDVIIGVPVGFVRVAEAKDLLRKCNIPHILTAGNKGGPCVAAEIVNAISILTEEDKD